MTFICSECGRRIDPDRVHWVDGKAYPDGIGCRLKDPEATIYNLCYDCLCKLGEGKKLKTFEHLRIAKVSEIK